MNWSSEQNAIYKWFASGKGALSIEAYAGSGKTTTIKEAFKHAPESKILYAVFNKKNQREALEKITDPRVDVKTLHALGYAFLRNAWKFCKPDDEVEQDRLDEVGVPDEFRGDVLKLVAFAKNTTIHTTVSDLENIADNQGIEFPAHFDGINAALEVLELSKTRDAQGRISFNDMAWLPVVLGLVRPWYDLVCIDEAQDMNLPQLTMARQACKKDGRIVVVGDTRQAIYSFRGAVQDAMNWMKSQLGADSLSLSVTYRCPKSVVKLAAEIVPGYRAADEAPDGLVVETTEATILNEATPGNAVLSRLNAPLMPLALALLRKNIPARIEGRDIGKQLITTVLGLKAKSVPHLLEKIESWATKQCTRLARSKNAEKRIEQVRDIAETISALAQEASSVSDVVNRLSNLFQDTEAGSRPAVVLSSVHKAKGLEWGRVYLLKDTFRNKSTEGEEANIYYVAVTRAKESLYICNGK